jgi:transcriptional regulator with XRE-family HTH domain
MKEARTHAGLSQERLGVLAGIDEMSSSARMNQYERGKHEPDFKMVERIAKVLNVPKSYFYTKTMRLHGCRSFSIECHLVIVSA